MRIFTLMATFFAISLQAYQIDTAADAQIKRATESHYFSNVVISYYSDGVTYPINVITNPERKPLWDSVLNNPITGSLYVIGNVPFQLRRHIESLLVINSHDIVINLTGEFHPYTFANASPVYIATSVSDPYIDKEIANLYYATQFSNKVYYYCLNGKYYRARIVHNPYQVQMSATQNFRLNSSSPLKGYAIDWSSKYAIATDQKAPQELIDHLTYLLYMSYWDRTFNFDVYNGEKVTYAEYDYGFFEDVTTTYTLDSWFNYMEYLTAN